jgi:hypothetical protein
MRDSVARGIESCRSPFVLFLGTRDHLGYVAFFDLLKHIVVVIRVKLIAMAITGAIAGGLIAVILGRMRSQAAACRIDVAGQSGSVPCRIPG